MQTLFPKKFVLNSCANTFYDSSILSLRDCILYQSEMSYLCWLLPYLSQIQVFEPFGILGLVPGASDSQIKKAYRRLSIQYHPDKNPDPG